MKRVLFSLTLLACGVALADGLPLKNGRYPGRVLVFSLTAQQKQVIDHFRTCHLDHFQTMNAYTPYVFTLTPTQAKALAAAKGFSPTRFTVYETYRGHNDAGPHWNVAVRFSEQEIEIPLDLVISDRKAKAAHNVQGWRTSNPCFPELASRMGR